MPCERCLNRRDFLASTGGAAFAAALVACGDGTISGVKGDPGKIPPVVGQITVKVADFPALAAAGTLVKVSSFIAAKRIDASSFDAFNMSCTHEGCLTEIVSGQRFDCPCHGSRFDSNGAVVRNPATRPLDKLATSYNAATDELTIN